MQLETPQRKTLSAESLLIWGALSGLFTGLIEIPLLVVEKQLSERAIFLGQQVIWMAAVADLLLFTVVGLAMLLLSWRWKWMRSAQTVITVFGFLALLSWLLTFPRIQWYASVLLAAGVATQAGRILASRLSALHPYAMRVARAAVAALILLAAAVEGRSHWNERQALAKLPPATPDAPNVLLIVMDTVRAQNLSLYGYSRKTTPQLERFAERGVVFERAISTAPWTTPSHAGMFTGHYPFECSTDWNKPLDEHHPTLAEGMQARGFATAGFIANTFGCGYETGLDRGFIHYEDYNATVSELLLSSSLMRTVVHSDPLRRVLGNHQVVTRKSAAEINREFLDWQGHTTRPFFAFLNYLDAHEPYLPPPPFDCKFGNGFHPDRYLARHDLRISFRYGREQLSAAEMQAEIDAYDGAIAYLDSQIGLLLDELEQRGVLEKTVVVITADHGESFGEHQDFGHGNSLYLSLLHVPLLIFFPPRVPVNQRTAETISLRDLPATILDLAGGNVLQIPGDSLAHCWSAHQSPLGSPALSQVNVAPIRPGRYPAGTAAPMCSVLQERLHYIKNANGHEELYDILSDPTEQTNLRENEDRRSLVDQFKCTVEKVN